MNGTASQRPSPALRLQVPRAQPKGSNHAFVPDESLLSRRCCSTPQLKGRAEQPQIADEPGGELLLDKCLLSEDVLTDLESATLVLHHLAELHPVDPVSVCAALCSVLLNLCMLACRPLRGYS